MLGREETDEGKPQGTGAKRATTLTYPHWADCPPSTGTEALTSSRCLHTSRGWLQCHRCHPRLLRSQPRLASQEDAGRQPGKLWLTSRPLGQRGRGDGRAGAPERRGTAQVAGPRLQGAVQPGHGPRQGSGCRAKLFREEKGRDKASARSADGALWPGPEPFARTLGDQRPHCPA